MFTLLCAAAGVQWQASLIMLRTSVPGSACLSELFPTFEVYLTRMRKELVHKNNLFNPPHPTQTAHALRRTPRSRGYILQLEIREFLNINLQPSHTEQPPPSPTAKTNVISPIPDDLKTTGVPLSMINRSPYGDTNRRSCCASSIFRQPNNKHPFMLSSEQSQRSHRFPDRPALA